MLLELLEQPPPAPRASDSERSSRDSDEDEQRPRRRVALGDLVRELNEAWAAAPDDDSTLPRGRSSDDDSSDFCGWYPKVPPREPPRERAPPPAPPVLSSEENARALEEWRRRRAPDGGRRALVRVLEEAGLSHLAPQLPGSLTLAGCLASTLDDRAGFLARLQQTPHTVHYPHRAPSTRRTADRVHRVWYRSEARRLRLPPRAAEAGEPPRQGVARLAPHRALFASRGASNPQRS